jgi:hypothetical protein
MYFRSRRAIHRMGKDLYSSALAKDLFEKANEY